MVTVTIPRKGIKDSRMYTIAISNEKGGVAKTTTTVSLAACLAEIGCQVLAIDLDPQANLTLSLGHEPNKAMSSMSAAFLKGVALDQLTQPSGLDRLFIIPSREDVGLAERVLPSLQNRQNTLRVALSKLQQPYDFVLIDCPPTLGALAHAAMVAADLLVIPTQAEYFSIYALRNLMSWIRQVRIQDNPALIYRLLMTLYDRRNRSHRVLSEHLRQSFDTGLLQTVIEIDTKLREAPIAGMPINQYASKSRASLQYRALAQEILAYAQETVIQPA
jgi:chromosome partitioning protein